MRVDYDKEALARLIKRAGGDLRLVERALGRAWHAKKSPYVTAAEVEAAMREVMAADGADRATAADDD